MKIDLPQWMQLLKGSIEDDKEEEVELLLAEPIGYNPEKGQGISSRVFGSVLGSIPKQKGVALLINTMGGQIDEGVAMYNMITARGNVTTRVVGYAGSMGAIIHQAGAKRQMMPGTMLLFHNPKLTVDGDYRDTSAATEFLGDVKKNLVNLLATRTGADKRRISNIMDAVPFYAMGPEEAKKEGFCDEIIDGSPVRNSIDLPSLVNSFRQLTSTPSAAGGPGGTPASTQTEQHSMKKLMEVLARLKLVPSADLNDEQAAAALETTASALIGERDQLKQTLVGHENALKIRVTNRVEQAIANKVVKPERKDGLISIGLRNEADLDFLNDLGQSQPPSAAPRRSGAPALPPAPPAEGDTVDSLRNSLNNGTVTSADQIVDPVIAVARENAKNARKLRELRGHTELFGKKN